MARPRRKRVPQAVKEHVRISEYSDLELLGVLADLGGESADVATEEVARRLFGTLVRDSVALGYAKQCVGGRMAWMHKFGFVDHGSRKGHWLLSEAGVQLNRGTLGAALGRGIHDIEDARALHLAAAVGERAQTTGDTAFRALERQLRYHMLQRKKSLR